MSDKALNLVRAQLKAAKKEMAAAQRNYLNACKTLGKAHEKLKAVEARGAKLLGD